MENFNLNFRDILPSDYPYLRYLYRSSREDVLQYGNHLTKEERNAFIDSQFDLQDQHYKKYYPDAKFRMILLEEDNVGRLYTQDNESDDLIMDIIIDPLYRGKGIGSKIMILMINKADRNNKSLSVHVEKESKALNFYKKLGFKVEKDKEVHFFMKKRPRNVGLK